MNGVILWALFGCGLIAACLYALHRRRQEDAVRLSKNWRESLTDYETEQARKQHLF